MCDISGNFFFNFQSCPFPLVDDKSTILALLQLSLPEFLVYIGPDGPVSILLYAPSLKFCGILVLTIKQLVDHHLDGGRPSIRCLKPIFPLHYLHCFLQRSLGSAIKSSDLVPVLFPYFFCNTRRFWCHFAETKCESAVSCISNTAQVKKVDREKDDQGKSRQQSHYINYSIVRLCG